MCQCRVGVGHLKQLGLEEVIVIYMQLPLFGTKINYKFIVLIGNELHVIMLLKTHNVIMTMRSSLSCFLFYFCRMEGREMGEIRGTK